MSRAALPKIGRTPLIALVDKAGRALQRDMVRRANLGGYPEVKQAHNAVFGTLPESGARATDMAERAGITRQSMGEILRDMVDLGIVEMSPDPDDRRAKLVMFTAYGRGMASKGYGRILDLEQKFAEELGEKEYEIVRDFLERLPAMLEDGA
jgi:DNA-binding MarR family transcriptional regulator